MRFDRLPQTRRCPHKVRGRLSPRLRVYRKAWHQFHTGLISHAWHASYGYSVEIEARAMDLFGVVEHHGYAVVVVGMFLTAAGVPLPASVLLLAAGASAHPQPSHHDVM